MNIYDKPRDFLAYNFFTLTTPFFFFCFFLGRYPSLNKRIFISVFSLKRKPTNFTSYNFFGSNFHLKPASKICLDFFYNIS